MTRAQRIIVIVVSLIIAWMLHLLTCEWVYKERRASHDLILVYENVEDPMPTVTGLVVDPTRSRRAVQADTRVYRLFVVILGIAVPLTIIGFDLWLLFGWRHSAQIARGLCPGCGYDLKGDGDRPAQRCPECGWRSKGPPDT